jgi:antitoxin HigA-1
MCSRTHLLSERLDRHKQNVYNSDMARSLHPGEFLAEILAEEKLTQAQFARDIGVSPMRVSHVINGSRPVTADLALRFGKAFDQTPQYWLNLQTDYDLAIARRAYAAEKRHAAKPEAKATVAKRRAS